jgi:endonuclease/exonuclease/phosphatase family metal-dependent hydrolase
MFDAGECAKFGAQTEKLSELTDLKNHYFAKAIDDGWGPYGNGFLSRYKIVNAETIKIPDPTPKRVEGGYYETRCILKAELENGFTVLVTHFGLNFDEQENAVKAVLENIKEEKCILMGVFNVEPSNPILDPIRAKMVDASLGFCENKPSWPSDAPRVKIDYIFVSPDVEVLCADIPNTIASDHRFHIAEIKL